MLRTAMPSSPSASSESVVVTCTANLQPSTATSDAQKGRERPLEEKDESGGTPQESSARPPPPPPPPPSTAAETASTDETEPSSLPTLGGLKLSLLGSCDAGRSPPAGLLPAGGFGGVGAVSPCESARSSASSKAEQGAVSFSDPPTNTGGVSRGSKDHQPSVSAFSSSSPFLSPSVDKLLQLPRGRSLRFFIDGDEGLGNEKRSEV